MDNLIAFPGVKHLAGSNDNLEHKAQQRVNDRWNIASYSGKMPVYYDTTGHILITVERNEKLHVIAVQRPTGWTVE